MGEFEHVRQCTAVTVFGRDGRFGSQLLHNGCGEGRRSVLPIEIRSMYSRNIGTAS